MAVTCEESIALRMPYLRKHGFLRPGYGGTLSWNWGGEPYASVGILAVDGAVILKFRHGTYGRDPHDVEQRVPLAFTPCIFGGERPWFRCRCGRRVGVLYLSGSPIFACRRCYGLCYRSQLEASHDRMMSKAHAIRKRLTGRAEGWGEIPEKPKGMHWRTYDRLVTQLDEYEEAADRAALVRFGRFF